jgi:DNA modification methylase
VIELYNADCYEKLKDIPDGSVDLVIIDPPYDIHAGFGGGIMKGPDKEYLNQIKGMSTGFSGEILKELCRVMKKINCYIFCSRKQILPLVEFFTGLSCNWELLVWCKSNPVPACCNKYLSDKEYILFFREKGVKVLGSFETKRTYYITPLNQKDKKLYGHPTIKPLNIVKNLITNSSRRGGVILDCFMGSGTTGVAAKELGRSFIGIELDEKYYKIAEKRIAEATEATENEPILRNTNEEGKPSLQGEKKGLQEG